MTGSRKPALALLPLALLLGLLAAGCGGGQVGGGEACDTQDDCSANKCISISDAACVRTGSICTEFCKADADCAAVAAGLRCVDDCLLHQRVCRRP